MVSAASVFYLLPRRRLVSAALALSTWFSLGALNILLRPQPAIPDIADVTDRSEVLVSAHVMHEGYIREAGFEELRQTIDVQTESVQSRGSERPLQFGLRLGIFAKVPETEHRVERPSPLFTYGQRLRFTARLRRPRNYGNPGSFDYQGYLFDQGIVALGSAKLEAIEVLPGFAGSRLKLWRARVHRRIIDKVHELWPEQQAGLLDAAVIGESAFLDRNTRVDFQRSGTYHILVVSGMNLSILAFVVFWTLRRFRASELLASALTIALCVGYAFLTDVGAPVWRATLMMAVYLGARLFYRDRASLNALGAAALALMIADPGSPLGASFQLTFLSVLIVAALAIPLLERSSLPYRHGLRGLDSSGLDPSLEPRVAQYRIDLRMIACRLARFLGPWFPIRSLALACSCGLAIYDVLVVSGLIQLGLALPMAWYFHRATVVSLPANILAVPLTEILMPSAVIALVLGFICPWLARVPALIAGWALDGITATVRGLGTLPMADMRLPLPDSWMVAATLLALIVSMILVRRRAFVSAAGLTCLAATSLWVALNPAPPRFEKEVLEVSAIDVGQGDATLIVTPDRHTMLVDAGGMPGTAKSNFDIGEDVISPYLWTRRIQNLDVVVVTHGHWDHVGGTRSLLTNFKPKELWIGENTPTPALAALIQYAEQSGVRVRSFSAGDVIAFGRVEVRTLAPAKNNPARPRRINDDCLALKLTYQQSSVLLEGDAEKTTERELVNQQSQADLLKVAHHGSTTSTSLDLLVKVHPRFAVISVGRENSYGHPRAEVLRRLGNSAAKTYRTDLDGLVTFYLDGANIRPAALR